MRHTLILTVDISSMLAPLNIVCQMQLLIYKKEQQNKNKKLSGPHDPKYVSHRFYNALFLLKR